jgi:hypothetical protein
MRKYIYKKNDCDNMEKNFIQKLKKSYLSGCI